MIVYTILCQPQFCASEGSLNNDRTVMSHDRPYVWHPLACFPILRG